MTLRLNGSASGYTELDAPAVAGNNNIKLPASNGSANNLLKNSGTAGTLEFASNVNIDSSGRLLVGTSTARSDFFNTSTFSPRFQVEGTDVNSSMASLVCNNTSAAPYFIFGRSRGTSTGSATAVASGDIAGYISFQAADGTDMVRAATIECAIDGTPGANDMPGRLVFSTTADGASSPTERMRIDNAGNALFNITTTANLGTSNSGVVIKKINADEIYIQIANRNSGSTAVAQFFNINGQVGSITTSGSATAYNTSSDYRLKENVVPLIDAVDRLNLLQVHRFNFKADPDTTVDGFIAHEAQAVVPECVTGTKDEVDADGNPVYQGIDQSKLVPLLTAALQEALAEIESLKARVTALEP